MIFCDCKLTFCVCLSLSGEYKRLETAKKFHCSVEQSSLVACFVRWRAVLSTRTQLEHMKKSIKVGAWLPDICMCSSYENNC